MKKSILFFICFSFLLINLFSQESLKSTEEEYFTFLSLQGKTERPYLNYRTLSDNFWILDSDNEFIFSSSNKHQIFTPKTVPENFFLNGISQSINLIFYGPEWFNSYNTKSPYGQNDAALWQGRGYNTSFSSGLRIEGYGFELSCKPQITFSQNKDFEILEGVYGNKYSYFYKGNIDLVQRFGDKCYWQYDLGDTEIRWSWYTLTFGLGTEAIWLGPAWLNPMLHSNNAPTYPKFDIGLRKQKVIVPGCNLNLGFIEGRMWVGQLTESDFFDNNTENNKRLTAGFNASYAPSFLPGFTLGLNKVCIAGWSNKAWKYLNPLYNENDVYGPGEDQKMSISAEWLLPKAGIDLYAELGLDDYSAEPITNPFHTAVYTVGLRKTIDIFESWEKTKKHNIQGELIFEFNNFEMSQDFQLQWQYMGYYSHGKISQGYTQKGQIIGAGSGYFGNSQFIGIRIYYPKGSFLFFAHRDCPDTNYIYNQAVNNVAANINAKYYAMYKTNISTGLSAEYLFTNSLLLNGEIDFQYTRFPLYKASPENFWASDIINFRFVLGAKYKL